MSDEHTAGEGEGEDWRARAQSAEFELEKLHVETGRKLIEAQLKAEAMRAGMIDMDGLKLVDFSDVTLDKNGELADGSGLFARLKRAKPWLFAQAASSSAGLHAPKPEPLRARHANELSHEEWLAARAALLRRR